MRQGEVVHFSSCSDRAPAPVVERLRRRDAAASRFQTAVAAAETLRRRTRRLLLRQQRRCGVALADCCCGSRDVAASHSHTVVAAAETLRRHTLRLLLRQQSAPSPAMCYASRVLGVTVEPAYFSMVGGKMVQPGSIVQTCSSSLLMLGETWLSTSCQEGLRSMVGSLHRCSDAWGE